MSAPPQQQPAAIAPAQAPPSRSLLNIWARSDPSMFTPLVDDSIGTTNTITTTTTDTMGGHGGLEDGTTDPNTQALQHKHSAATIDTLASNESASSSSTTTATATGIEDLMSRGDVFAGVIVFSIGMLVLIIAVTFYFANGRSLRTVRRNRSRNRRGQDDMRSGDAGDNGVCVGTEVNQEGDIDLEQNVHTVMSTVPTGAGAGTGAGGGVGMTERTSTFDPHSPSTARLIDHPTTSSPSSSFPSTSVFSFLKGTRPSSSSPSNNNSIRPKNTELNATSIISKTGQDYETRDGGDSEATTALHMPVLTRTKARSSCKKKSKGMISLFSSATTSSNSGTLSKKQKQQQRQAAALEIARSASAIIIQVQEPSEPASARPFTPNTNHDTPSSSSFSPSDAYQEDPSEDIFSPINPHPHNTTHAHPYPPPLLRLEMPSQIRSSSLVGLYGSAKSSPNGSMLDAASTRAIYCTSLKSAISFLPAESSTSTLGVLLTAELNPPTTTTQGDDAGQDSDEKEIVIATAGLEVDLTA